MHRLCCLSVTPPPLLPLPPPTAACDVPRLSDPQDLCIDAIPTPRTELISFSLFVASSFCFGGVFAVFAFSDVAGSSFAARLAPSPSLSLCPHTNPPHTNCVCLSWTPFRLQLAFSLTHACVRALSRYHWCVSAADIGTPAALQARWHTSRYPERYLRERKGAALTHTRTRNLHIYSQARREVLEDVAAEVVSKVSTCFCVSSFLALSCIVGSCLGGVWCDSGACAYYYYSLLALVFSSCAPACAAPCPLRSRPLSLA